jgi:hypothetical protein
MSQENVEVVRAMFEAFNRYDYASAVEYVHPRPRFITVSRALTRPSQVAVVGSVVVTGFGSSSSTVPMSGRR